MWPVAFLERCRRRYGPLFTFRTLGLGDIVVVVDPQLIGQVFRGDGDVFRAGRANAALGPVLGEHSLLLLDGDRHLRERRMLLPPFHGDAVRAYGERVARLAQEEVDRWPVGVAFPMRDRMRAITLEVILQAVIGVRDPVRLKRLRGLLPQLLDFSVLDMWAVWMYPRLIDSRLGRRHRSQRVRPEVDRLLFAEIADHRSNADGRDDVLAMLIAARDEDGQPLSDEALRDELITLLLAGHETTTTGLAWCFERLVRHPDVLARLESELETQDGDRYLEAVINETLRARPVIDAVWRELAAPAEVGDYVLPAGVKVMPSIALVHRSEAYQQPDEFRPERFLDATIPPYTLIPFGGGPRRCIGASFALMEMRTIVRTVIGAARVRAPQAKPEAVRLHHITLVPARGARVIVTQRKPAKVADRDRPVPAYS